MKSAFCNAEGNEFVHPGSPPVIEPQPSSSGYQNGSIRGRLECRSKINRADFKKDKG
jgi:hypothetical protein